MFDDGRLLQELRKLELRLVLFEEELVLAGSYDGTHEMYLFLIALGLFFYVIIIMSRT